MKSRAKTQSQLEEEKINQGLYQLNQYYQGKLNEEQSKGNSSKEND